MVERTILYDIFEGVAKHAHTQTHTQSNDGRCFKNNFQPEVYFFPLLLTTGPG